MWDKSMCFGVFKNSSRGLLCPVQCLKRENAMSCTVIRYPCYLTSHGLALHSDGVWKRKGYEREGEEVGHNGRPKGSFWPASYFRVVRLWKLKIKFLFKSCPNFF